MAASCATSAQGYHRQHGPPPGPSDNDVNPEDCLAAIVGPAQQRPLWAAERDRQRCRLPRQPGAAFVIGADIVADWRPDLLILLTTERISYWSNRGCKASWARKRIWRTRSDASRNSTIRHHPRSGYIPALRARLRADRGFIITAGTQSLSVCAEQPILVAMEETAANCDGC